MTPPQHLRPPLVINIDMSIGGVILQVLFKCSYFKDIICTASLSYLESAISQHLFWSYNLTEILQSFCMFFVMNPEPWHANWCCHYSEHVYTDILLKFFTLNWFNEHGNRFGQFRIIHLINMYYTVLYTLKKTKQLFS